MAIHIGGSIARCGGIRQISKSLFSARSSPAARFYSGGVVPPAPGRGASDPEPNTFVQMIGAGVVIWWLTCLPWPKKEQVFPRLFHRVHQEEDNPKLDK